MPNILDTGHAAAKAEANRAALDSVTKRKVRGEFDAHGNIEGSVDITRKGWTFTGYVKALVKGPNKGVTAGGRVEKEL